MNLDFDLVDLISTDAPNKAKASTKFKPKAKPKHKPNPKPKTQPEPVSAPTPSKQFVEAAAIADSNELIGKTKENQQENGVNENSGNNIDNWQPSFEKSQEENADSVLTLDSYNDFLPESTTTTVNMTPSVNEFIDENLGTGPEELDLSNNINASANLESIAEVDPLTGEEATIFNDNEDFHIEDLSSGLKDAEVLPSWESLDILSQSKTRSGLRVCKFKPKPKAKTHKVEHIAKTPDQDVGPTQYEENIRSFRTQTDFMDNEHLPSFTPDEIFGSPSIRETVNLEDISQVDSMNEPGRSSERSRRRTNKTLGLIDLSEDEGIGNTLVHGNEDNDNNDEYLPQNESLSQKKGSKTKSKKVVNEKEKPVRKRKKAGEVTEESTKVTKKKFSHGTRRNKRSVDPELLKMPEDELELHMPNVPMKELIRLAEHRERLAKKDASTSGTPENNQSNEHGAFAQGMGSDHEHGIPTEAQNATYYNYRTHMKITPRMKWSKQDTELFYEAIQQFGTDLSMIKECFPGRTREQIKSKYKKEERQQPLRLNDALSTRAKGHSHFEVVIERLKQAQAEESEDDEPINLTGEEDEMAPTDINKAVDATKPEHLEKEVKDDVPESPTKSHDSDDDMFRWSQYKSDI